MLFAVGKVGIVEIFESSGREEDDPGRTLAVVLLLEMVAKLTIEPGFEVIEAGDVFPRFVVAKEGKEDVRLGFGKFKAVVPDGILVDDTLWVRNAGLAREPFIGRTEVFGSKAFLGIDFVGAVAEVAEDKFVLWKPGVEQGL